MSKPSPILSLARVQDTNMESARIILNDSERYGGSQSLMVRWAEMVLDSIPKWGKLKSCLGTETPVQIGAPSRSQVVPCAALRGSLAWFKRRVPDT